MLDAKKRGQTVGKNASTTCLYISFLKIFVIIMSSTNAFLQVFICCACYKYKIKVTLMLSLFLHCDFVQVMLS